MDEFMKKLFVALQYAFHKINKQKLQHIYVIQYKQGIHKHHNCQVVTSDVIKQAHNIQKLIFLISRHVSFVAALKCKLDHTSARAFHFSMKIKPATNQIITSEKFIVPQVPVCLSGR